MDIGHWKLNLTPQQAKVIVVKAGEHTVSVCVIVPNVECLISKAKDTLQRKSI